MILICAYALYSRYKYFLIVISSFRSKSFPQEGLLVGILRLGRVCKHENPSDKDE